MLEWTIVQDILSGPFGRVATGAFVLVATIAAILRLNEKSNLPSGLYAAMLIGELLVLCGIGLAFWFEGDFSAAIATLRRANFWITAGFAAVIFISAVLLVLFQRRGQGRR